MDLKQLRSDFDYVRNLIGTIDADVPPYYAAVDRLFPVLDELLKEKESQTEVVEGDLFIETEEEDIPVSANECVVFNERTNALDRASKHTLKYQCMYVDTEKETRTTKLFYVWECIDCRWLYYVQEKAWHIIRKGLLPTEEDLL